MKHDSVSTGRVRTQNAVPNRRHSFWVWLLVVTIAVLLVLAGRSAAAQTKRGIEVIETAMALQPNPRQGRAIYRDHCATCHGRSALGDATDVIPALAGQIPLYLVKELVDVAEGDRGLPAMHRLLARKTLATPQALRDVATYLSKLPPNSRPEYGDGLELVRGRQLYEGLCAFCHGRQAEGNPEHATPALQGQHYSYLLMQMRQMAVGHRYSVDIVVIEELEALPLEYVEAIADYASRLPDESAAVVSEQQAVPEANSQLHESSREAR